MKKKAWSEPRLSRYMSSPCCFVAFNRIRSDHQLLEIVSCPPSLSFYTMDPIAFVPVQLGSNLGWSLGLGLLGIKKEEEK